MLEHVSSREISEWMAYEKVAGPLGSIYADDVLAGVHELLQQANYAFAEANFTDRSKGKQNPVPEPKALPRRHELNPPKRKLSPKPRMLEEDEEI